MGPVRILLLLIRGVLLDRAELAAENLALRQQLAALHQKSKRPRLRKRDRIFWAILYRIWPNWRNAYVRGAPDRLDPPRMPGPPHRVERATPAAHPSIVLRLLSTLANASLIGSKRAR